MKKLALILALILIMGCAYAEPVQVGYVEDVNRIYGANLFYKRLENGYALFDFDNNRLTEGIYSGSFNCRSGMLRTYLAKGEGVNIYGVLAADGTEVLPFKYGDVDVLNEHWAYGLTLVEAADRNNFDYEVTINDVANVYFIDTVDVYSLETGMIKSFTRENFSAIYPVGNCVNVMDRATGNVITYDANFNELGVIENGSVYNDDYAVSDFNTFYEDGRYGATDAQGNVIVEANYAFMYYPDEGEYATIEKNDKEGIIDIQGNVIIEPQFDEIEILRCMPKTMDAVYYYDGYVLFEQDGKLGYATSAGVTCEAKYSDNVLDNHGLSCSFIDMEGNYNIMAADGIVTTITGYEDITPASYSGGYYYIVRDDDYNRGLIDWHGNVVFPCEYNDIEFSADGQFVLVSPESYGDVEIYAINEAQEAAPAAAEVPAEAPAEAPAKFGGLGSVKLPDVDFSAYSQPAAEAPAADNSGAIAMLQSAKSLLEADAAANGAAAQVLVDSAVAMLAGNPAAAILDGAKALLTADAAANSAAIITLIDSAISLL